MLAINTARTLRLALAASACLALHADVGPHPSVHDTVAGILDGTLHDQCIIEK